MAIELSVQILERNPAFDVKLYLSLLVDYANGYLIDFVLVTFFGLISKIVTQKSAVQALGWTDIVLKVLDLSRDVDRSHIIN